MEKRKVDLLHPLNSLKWKSCKQLPAGMRDARAVFFQGKLYVGGGTTIESSGSAKLYVYQPKDDSWLSTTTPVSHFALAVCRSQLVLVGGRKYDGAKGISGPATNEILVVPNMGLGKWATLCKMKHRRCNASAIGIGDLLIVTGGEQEAEVLDIEIFRDGKLWNISKRPFDLLGDDLKVEMYNGDYYILGGKEGRAVFCASLASLKAACKTKKSCDNDPLRWKKLPDVPEQVAGGCLIAFGNRLLVLNGGSLYAFSPYTKSWVLIHEVPNGQFYGTCAVVLCTGEMMILGGISSQCGSEDKQFEDKVIQASLEHVTSFDSRKNLTKEGLQLLEHAVGIPILSELKAKPAFLRLLQVKKNTDILYALEQWITTGVKSQIPATWNKLLLILRLVDLDSLADDVDEVLHSSMVRAESCQDKVKGEILPRNHNATLTAQNSCSVVSHTSNRGGDDCHYSARIFYIPSPGEFEINVAIVKDVSDHDSSVLKDYKDKGAHVGPHQLVKFEKDEISLRMSQLEPPANDGYNITPSNHPLITKKQVDTFESGKIIPSCRFTAKFPRSRKLNISYRIELSGAKSPYNYFVINTEVPIKDDARTADSISRSPSKRTLPHSDSDEGYSSTKKSRMDESIGMSSLHDSKPRLKDLLKELIPKAALWENIGVMLEISDGVLETIKCNNPNNAEGCLREMLRVWLNNTVDPPPSWPVMVDALIALGIDQVFVHRLKSKYCI